MSIGSCEQCGKKISSLAPICDHCGWTRGDASSEDVQRFKERSVRDRLYRLGMFSYASMTMVIVAFGWYWVSTGSFQHPSESNGPYYLMMVGALSYLVIRILIFRARGPTKSHPASRNIESRFPANTPIVIPVLQSKDRDPACVLLLQKPRTGSPPSRG